VRRPGRNLGSGSEQHGFGAATEVGGFDAGDGEMGALGGEQRAEGVEVVVVFGDDLAEPAVGGAVGGLEAFEPAERVSGRSGAGRGRFALRPRVGWERGTRKRVGRAEEGGGGLLDVVDAHEPLLAVEEEAVDLDLLIGAHQSDGGRRRRFGGVARETRVKRRAENSGELPTEHSEYTEGETRRRGGSGLGGGLVGVGLVVFVGVGGFGGSASELAADRGREVGGAIAEVLADAFEMVDGVVELVAVAGLVGEALFKAGFEFVAPPGQLVVVLIGSAGGKRRGHGSRRGG